MTNNYTYEKGEDFTLVEEGDYEATINKIEIKQTPSGKEKIAIQYRIRDDVEQKAKNRIVFEDIWKEKDSPEHFNRKRLNKLLDTQELEDGTVFNSITELLNELAGSYLIIHVTTEFNEYTNKEQNRVSYYKKSMSKPKSLTGRPISNANNTPSMPNTDDDLPF